MLNPGQEPPPSSKAPNEHLNDMDVLCTFKIMIESQNLEHGCFISVTISKSRSRSNPSQEPPASPKDMDVLCTFKIKIESQFQNIGVSKTSDHIQIKIKMPNPSQEPPASTKAPNEDLKDMDVLHTSKIKIGSQNLDLGCIK